nr:hypothetical protein [Acidiferrobacter thiooxydans]
MIACWQAETQRQTRITALAGYNPAHPSAGRDRPRRRRRAQGALRVLWHDAAGIARECGDQPILELDARRQGLAQCREIRREVGGLSAITEVGVLVVEANGDLRTGLDTPIDLAPSVTTARRRSRPSTRCWYKEKWAAAM